MRSQAPAMAQWLLDRFGISQANEPLVGDLVEEYGSGRSALWFWTQTMTAISTTIARDIRNHKLLAVRAIGLGWVLMAVWYRFVLLVQPPLYVPYRPGWNRARVFQILLLVTLTLWPAFVGWVVARTHRAQQAAMVLAYAASWVIWTVGYLSLHYHEIKRMPIPNQLNIDIAVSCIVLFFTLVGGFIRKPYRVRH